MTVKTCGTTKTTTTRSSVQMATEMVLGRVAVALPQPTAMHLVLTRKLPILAAFKYISIMIIHDLYAAVRGEARVSLHNNIFSEF
jgi:hypothetical protein